MTFLDRIKETSTSTGTGAFTLGGAVLGYKVFTNGTYKYCIVNETESEWEVGEGTVTSGVLTRTTIEASSNGGAAVVFTAGTKYVFNTVSAAYVNSLVPYTGATANVNLGAYSITATNIIRAGGLATQFLKADGSVDSTTYMNRAVYDTDGNGVVDAAEKMQTIGRNSTGVTLYKGTIVYISGSTGNRPNFVKAQANSEATSAGTFGVVVSDIANNSDGYVATIGTLADLDTRTTATNPFTSVTLADGDTIYLDPNTAGYVTNVKPSAPNHIVYVGKVVRTSPTLGTIVYRIQNGYELSEIHDVSISSVANNDLLVYESSSTLWKNKSIATILGYTPQAAITLTTTGSSGASTFVSNTLNIPTYTLAGLGGQAQLNGTGFVKATGTTISYDNTTYATDSLVVHLAGAENITGVKTFQNSLQTTTGNNLLNTGGGNTVIGYTADPATSSVYKLDVNGGARVVQDFFARTVTGISKSSSVQNLAIGTASGGGGTATAANFTSQTFVGWASGYIVTGGSNATVVGTATAFNTANVTSSTIIGSMLARNVSANISQVLMIGVGDNLDHYPTIYAENIVSASPNVRIGGNNTANSSMPTATTASALLELSSTTKGFLLPRMTTAQKTSITTPATSLLVYDTDLAAFQYYSGSAWTSLGGISGSGTAGQVTYWSGTSAVTGSSNFTYSSNILSLTRDNGINSGTLDSILTLQKSSTLQSISLGYYSRSGTANDVVGISFDKATYFNFLYQNTFVGGYGSNGMFSFGDPLHIVNSVTGILVHAKGGIQINSNTTGFVTNASYAMVYATNNTGAGGDLVLQPRSNASRYIHLVTGATPTLAMSVTPAQNILIGNTTTDGGQRLQVIGSMRVGTTAASAMYWDDTNARLIIGNTSGTARLDVGASTTSAASLRIRSGTAPTTPNEGDIWQDGTNIKIYIGGSTKTFTII